MELLSLPGVNYCEFQKNDTIIHQGENLEAVYYLISGVCHRKALNKKGDEIIYGVKEPQASTNKTESLVQSVLGILILFNDDGLSNCNFSAQEKCCCYRIPRDVFLGYVKNKPEILILIVQQALKEFRLLTKAFQARQEGEVANHLCRLLLNHAKKDPAGTLSVRGLSNMAISQLLGIHEVTVNRILRALKTEGTISKTRTVIVIQNQSRMEAYTKAERRIDY